MIMMSWLTSNKQKIQILNWNGKNNGYIDVKAKEQPQHHECTGSWGEHLGSPLTVYLIKSNWLLDDLVWNIRYLIIQNRGLQSLEYFWGSTSSVGTSWDLCWAINLRCSRVLPKSAFILSILSKDVNGRATGRTSINLERSVSMSLETFSRRRRMNARSELKACELNRKLRAHSTSTELNIVGLN